MQNAAYREKFSNFGIEKKVTIIILRDLGHLLIIEQDLNVPHGFSFMLSNKEFLWSLKH
jgi:hypothetical protein